MTVLTETHRTWKVFARRNCCSTESWRWMVATNEGTIFRTNSLQYNTVGRQVMEATIRFLCSYDNSRIIFCSPRICFLKLHSLSDKIYQSILVYKDFHSEQYLPVVVSLIYQGIFKILTGCIISFSATHL
jgi:hypothetical protein